MEESKENEVNSSPKEVNQINTFVFLDLESTGLTSRPRITELSLVAVSRVHLLQMNKSSKTNMPSETENGLPSTLPATSTPMPCSSTTSPQEPVKRSAVPKLPRVLHKYTRLYYPWKLIHPASEKCAGLSNESLEHLPGFTEDSVKALSLFLDLPKPVALVAHNGKRFDFPLLKAELIRVGHTDALNDVQCVDTLLALREIDALIENEVKNEINYLTLMADSFNIDDFSEEFPDIFSPNKRPRTRESDEESGRSWSCSPPRPQQSISFGNIGNNHQVVIAAEAITTPTKSQLPSQALTPATPTKPSYPPALPHTSERPQPAIKGTPNSQTKTPKGTTNVRRVLTYENGTKKEPKKRVLYNQPTVYRRLFNADYEAHRAEEDCKALLTICSYYGTRFVEWADKFATGFVKVEPMWRKRETFNLTHEG